MTTVFDLGAEGEGERAARGLLNHLSEDFNASSVIVTCVTEDTTFSLTKLDPNDFDFTIEALEKMIREIKKLQAEIITQDTIHKAQGAD